MGCLCLEMMRPSGTVVAPLLPMLLLMLLLALLLPMLLLALLLPLFLFEISSKVGLLQSIIVQESFS